MALSKLSPLTVPLMDTGPCGTMAPSEGVVMVTSGGALGLVTGFPLDTESSIASKAVPSIWNSARTILALSRVRSKRKGDNRIVQGTGSGPFLPQQRAVRSKTLSVPWPVPHRKVPGLESNTRLSARKTHNRRRGSENAQRSVAVSGAHVGRNAHARRCPGRPGKRLHPAGHIVRSRSCPLGRSSKLEDLG